MTEGDSLLAALTTRDFYVHHRSYEQVERRRYNNDLADALAVIRDQKRHIALLEEQLLPHIGHEADGEQEALL